MRKKKIIALPTDYVPLKRLSAIWPKVFAILKFKLTRECKSRCKHALNLKSILSATCGAWIPSACSLLTPCTW